jgi:phytoene synthase
MMTIPRDVRGLREKTPVPGQRSATAEPLSPVAALVRHHDRDRFQTVLFAPAARREALFALYAFNYEIARVREAAAQPTLGRIRLEWWRETIAAVYGAAPVRRHPVAEALAAAVRERGLSRAHLDRLIDARDEDCDDRPPADTASLEHYAEGTSSSLVLLALEALAVRHPAASEAGRHIGVAYALAGLLRALPLRGTAARPIIPADVAARNGLDPDRAAPEPGSPAVAAAVAEIATAAQAHLRSARALAAIVPRAALPALLPAVIAARSLQRLARAGCDPFAPGLIAPDPLQSWRLAFAMIRRRF